MFEIESKALPEVEESKTEEQFDGGETNLPVKQEIDSRIKPNFILTLLNFEIIDYGFEHIRQPRAVTSSDEIKFVDKETYFPRLSYLCLDDSLIDIHLQIFQQLKFLFSRFLELRDWYLHSNQGGY